VVRRDRPGRDLAPPRRDTGLVLLLPHLLLSTNPHGTALGGPLAVIGAIGMVALAAWAILPRWRSVVPSPLRRLVVAARDAPVTRDVRGIFGDYTSRLRELIEPGMPAVIGGPHGRFSHWKGTDQQVWIAGGVGVAPFLSWLRALDGHLRHRVDFFYSVRGRRCAASRRSCGWPACRPSASTASTSTGAERPAFAGSLPERRDDPAMPHLSELHGAATHLAVVAILVGD
jgi:hypothetical protein